MVRSFFRLTATSFLKDRGFCNAPQELPLVALVREQNQAVFRERLAAFIRARQSFEIQLLCSWYNI